MKVFKFGGASVKDADSIKNVAGILSSYQQENIFVVISAMGKTTNALEEFTRELLVNSNNAHTHLDKIKEFHFSIIRELFQDQPNHPVFDDIHNTFVELDWMLDDSLGLSFDNAYDQIVSMGELLSTKIISHYLNKVGITNKWIDVRDFLRTDNNYREANIEWDVTQQLYDELKDNFFTTTNRLCITQGFIGCTSENFTTTLGREGSDYTASIIAFLNQATELIIWKDVPGVMSGDPKKFPEAVLIPHLSYHDAVELTYYGATIIHPKTIKPIQNKNIPLLVKSFVNPHTTGTIINNQTVSNSQECFIHKPNQILLSISGKDFSFIVEENISKIFAILAQLRVKVNLMQNSALSFSVCVDNFSKKTELIKKLSTDFFVKYNEAVELYTVRNYNNETLKRIAPDKEILVEQRSRNTLQLVIK
ncbi:MAG: aspartate kinase [Bacteroidia bacterium]|nr:aspartate kinase [Bacteroidia bacterium]MCZ2247481.1 aspartate kinase [Bacteroidia bacterium]